MALKIRFDDDFYLKEATVYGIVCELPSYRLGFYLNQALNLKLCRCKHDRELYWKDIVLLYPEFDYEDSIKMVTWHLTANKEARIRADHQANEQQAAIPLVSDLKQFDYFLWFEDEHNIEIASSLNLQLKALPYVRAFQSIETSSSKHIKNLLLEF